MNLTTMDYFIALAEERSFTKAADRLHVTQQTLSAHIASIEKELGSSLVERSIPLKLTYAGEVFLQYAHKFQRAQRSMEQEFLDIAKNERGNLKIGVAATRGHIIMPQAIAQFRKEHPGITIDLHEGVNTDLIDLLKMGELDMIIANISKKQTNIKVEHLYREEVVLVVSNKLLEDLYGNEADRVIACVEETKTLDALKDCPFLLVGRQDVPGNIARQIFEKTQILPEIAAISRNAETLLALVEEGVGACFLPGELVASLFPKGSSAGLRVAHIGDAGYYTISAAWKQADHIWSIIPAFYETLNKQLNDTEYLRSFI